MTVFYQQFEGSYLWSYQGAGAYLIVLVFSGFPGPEPGVEIDEQCLVGRRHEITLQANRVLAKISFNNNEMPYQRT